METRKYPQRAATTTTSSMLESTDDEIEMEITVKERTRGSAQKRAQSKGGAQTPKRSRLGVSDPADNHEAGERGQVSPISFSAPLNSRTPNEDATVSPESMAHIKNKGSSVKRKRQASSYEGPSTGTEYSIAEIIKHHAKLVRRAAKAWVVNYERDQNKALIELLNSLFEVCGVDFIMDGLSVDETDVDDIVVKVVSRAEEGFLEDYLGSKQKDLRGFRENLVSFWDNLILECQNGPLFDGVLLDKCMDYVIALSCTPPRVFRQVTTAVGLQMVTSLVSIAKTLGESRETAQRQLNAEKKKRKDGPRFEALNKVLSETHEKITKAEEMMRKIFTGLFMHRYRDVDAEIRMSCIRALGSWIVSYPSLFLQDLYLKYIGWTLNDKNPAVRKTSIMGLQKLYEIEDNVPSLGLFTERFCGRMIELADDIDISVAVSAIVLLKHLLRHQLLGDEDLGPLYDLLIDESPLIRHAVGDLVYEHLIAQKFSSSHSRGSETDGSEVQLSRLLQILREFSSDPILSDYVIDAVWQEMDAIKDWKSMISMLLDDNPKLELTDQDATHLIRVLSASAKKAVGGKIVPSMEPRKVTLTKAQKESLENNRNEITTALMKSLPKICRKYLADKAKIPHIVDLIMHMNLEQFNLKRQEQTFSQVMQLIKEAFFKHGEENVLKACVKALAFCGGESQAELHDSAQQTMKLMEDELVVKLRSALKEAGVVDDDYSLTVNLRRLHQMQLNRSLTNESLFSDLTGLLENFNNLEDEVVQLTLLNMFLHIIWCLKHLDFDNPDEAGMSSLMLKRDTLLKQLESFATSVFESYKQGNAKSLLCCTICVILSDLWSFFSKAKLSGTKLEPLGIYPSAGMLHRFWELCELRLSAVDDDDEEEDVTDEHLEYLNQKDVIVSAAAKLVAHEIVSKDYLGPEIISHFVMHGKTVAETIKHMLLIVKKNTKSSELANLYLEAIKRAYSRHKSEVQKTDEDWSTSRSFLDCKELASKLSATFSGSARNLYKSIILSIVKEGLNYAFHDAPKQLPFLEGGVLQFALKLPPSEVQEILTDSQRRVEGVNTDEDPSSWRPYFTFVDYLREKAFKAPLIEGEKAGSGARQQSRSRKAGDIQGKKLFEGDNTTDDDEQASDSEGEKHAGEADDTPVRNARRKTRVGDAGTSKGRAFQATNDGALADIPAYNNSLYGSATEEQLPV